MTLPTKDALRELIEAHDYRPTLAHDLASQMGVGPDELHKFLRLVKSLESDGALLVGKDGRLSPPSRFGMVSGSLTLAYKGHGFIAGPDNTRYFVGEKDLGGALHGDIVLAKLQADGKGGQQAKVMRVIKHGITSLTGIYYQHRGYGEVKPDDGRFGFSLFIASDDAGEAQDSDRVLAAISRYPSRGQDARGKIEEVIGQAGDPEVDAQAMLLRFGFPISFSEDALRQASEIPKNVRPDQAKGRLDLRQDLIVTIDGEDAKDFDDAVSLLRTKGGWRLGVHIADVSTYVDDGTAIDQDAFRRATSVYLHGFVLPMLPFELSNNICSLKPEQDRLCVSTFMDFDESGKHMFTDVSRSVINSRFRLTYESVNKYYESGQARQEWPEGLSSMLDEMREFAGILATKRRDRGSLDFDFPEWRVQLDRNGSPTDIYQFRRGDAEKLIEEFMIACNESIAAHLFHLGLPCMFRVHETPAKKSLDELNELIEPLGYRVRGTNNPHPREIQSVLDQVKGKPEETFVSDLVLRSLKKARYAPTWLGHFGLASPMYCHFTSPIRRYPDLIVHRILGSVLDSRWHGGDWAKHRSALDENALHCSEREIAAEMAERQSLENMKLRYMKNKIGEVFTGNIADVLPFGFFVELENGISGLVHISGIGEGWYDFDETKKTLRPRRGGGRVYKPGQTVTVQVSRVDIPERKIDFELVRDE